MPRIAFFEVSADEQPMLQERLPQHPQWSATYAPEPLTAATVRRAQGADVLSVFTSSRVSAEVFASLPGVQLVALRCTGFDNVDLAAAARHAAGVCNVPFYGENTVAEYAFGLMIALMRRFPETWRRTARADFSRTGLIGHDLQGRTAGVIGTGHIGRRFAGYAHALGMRVLAYDPHPDQQLADAVVYLALEDLLPQADVISIHVPYTAQTHHLLNGERLALLKPGAMIVNTARGGVMDTRALARCLRQGRIGGLALDTTEGEEVWLAAQEQGVAGFSGDMLGSAIITLELQLGPNVILTPHNAFNSVEALARIIDTTLENIAAWLNRTPQNLVGHP